MTPATLTPPEAPGAAPPGAPSGAGVPAFSVRPPLRRDPRRDPTGRLTRGAVALSAGVHLLLALAFVLAPAGRSSRLADPEGGTRTDELVQYIDVSQWPGADAGGAPSAVPAGIPAQSGVSAAAVDSAVARLQDFAPAFPSRVPGRLPPAPAGGGQGPGAAAVPGAPGAGAAAGAGAGQGNGIDGNAAGGALGPGYRDRRLIVRPEAVPERELTEHERYVRGLAGRIQEYNDSIAGEAERQRRIRNWTVKDKDGREWGIGEGGVPIVAGRRIPVPIAPPITRDRDTENRERAQARQREEIDRQADAADRDRNFRERTRATRERRDREREERRKASGEGSGGNP